jgi:hypothetical protein
MFDPAGVEYGLAFWGYSNLTADAVKKAAKSGYALRSITVMFAPTDARAAG